MPSNNGVDAKSQVTHLRDPIDQESSPKKIMKLSHPPDEGEGSSGSSSDSESEVSQESTDHFSHEKAPDKGVEGKDEDDPHATSSIVEEGRETLESKLKRLQEECWWKDMEGYSAPHKMWPTFYNGWSEDKKNFYKGSLINKPLNQGICKFCPEFCDSKHFLCVCEPLHKTLKLERHDAVLKIIAAEIESAVKNKRAYFSEGEDWKVLWYIQSKTDFYQWPVELNITTNKRPHLVAYSMSLKRVLIIEPSISWEHWIYLNEEDKTNKYMDVKKEFEENGFEVTFRVIILGARGVFIQKLYDLFEQICGMKKAEILNTHREISREIISVPYESKYYEALMKS